MRIDVLDRGLNKMAKAGKRQIDDRQREGRGSRECHHIAMKRR